MNKNIKRIITMALAVGTVSAAAPATNLNLLTTKAYAENSDADYLDSVDLQDDDGDTLDLYTDSGYDDELDDDLEEGETYYAESSTDQVSIDSIDGADEDNVRIFLNGDDNYDDAIKVGKSIDLEDGTNKFSIRVYEDAYDDYDEDDIDDADYNEYKVKVEYSEDDSDSSDDENDVDTLDSLELLNADDNNIKLYSDNDYDSDNKVDSDEVEEGETYYAKTSSDSISVDIDGPDENYVKIFKSTSGSAKGVDPGDDISLSSDKTLTVRIYSSEPDSDVTYDDDSDVVGEYKIKVEYTGNSDSEDDDSTTTTTTATSTPNTATEVSVVKNKWLQVNGKWQYKDATGNTVKNSWVQNYYVQADGNMATEWLSNGGKWYYLGTDGAKKTGWQKVTGAWYYMDTQGVMQTGWLLDRGNGKWYYLNSNGSMAYSTTIGGYKLGADGAWIK